MQPSNPLGAFIFWSYIIAALGLSIKTIYTIRKLPNSDSPRRIRHERLHISLALLSFTVLSYNMLHVLFRSFNEWSIPEPPVPLKLSIAFLQRVGLWSWTSSLFFDFGTAIVASPSEYLYTQSALLVTFWLSVDLSVEGRHFYSHRASHVLSPFLLADTQHTRPAPSHSRSMVFLRPRPDTSDFIHPESALPCSAAYTSRSNSARPSDFSQEQNTSSIAGVLCRSTVGTQQRQPNPDGGSRGQSSVIGTMDPGQDLEHIGNQCLGPGSLVSKRCGLATGTHGCGGHCPAGFRSAASWAVC